MKLIALSFVMLTLVAFADETKKEENFEQRKAEKLAHFDKRIGFLQEAKTCVQASTTNDAMKACHKDMKGKMKGLHKERKSRMKEWKDKKMERRQEKKKS